MCMQYEVRSADSAESTGKRQQIVRKGLKQELLREKKNKSM